ncbi:3-hydroxyacyl-CoA dehydrogenase family protein [Thermomonospora curvata]|uniref:3-hydroxybutyryl-CoA dehydrogenase n=1 Tax=Thermomonospora curvata (strain ATCC 19995 / DSM 43183 / JCM 3096 / KCTC 9072 / NBRC 15933 / NCIMB 10081 / Henssen B9) TaxID=471852 RepID=D1AE03_THECD|nr:3-hydroxyacyl-CoA dehydrogenase [Thermomonospora curvata]ACY99429.1 3-hydroxybutyryl-CoA dehydrogenase [Thermomonospora curvata DSM 43183]
MSGGSFSKAGVVGLGTMGAGIAEVLARGGLAVVGIEINDEALARGRGHVENSTGRAVKRGKLTEEAKQQILDRITFSTDFADLADCDLVIEAVPERMDLKRRVFAELDKVCRADAVLATNTSSLSVTEIAVGTARPSQVVGVHFFNPAPVMKLVEVIGTPLAEPAALARVAELVKSLGKTPVTVGNRAGFVANRLLLPYLNHAAALYEEGHATAEDIDTAMKVGAGLPMGPFTLMDMIGLDICLEALEAIYRETRDRRHAPAPILRELVTAGLLGRKTGRGFYSYDSSDAGTAASAQEAPQPLVGVMGSGAQAVAFVARCARAGAQVRYVTEDESAQAALQAELSADELSRVTVGTEPGSLADCDLVVEAAAGDAAAKRPVLAAVAGAARADAVLASLADTGGVIEVATAAARAADVVGLHFPEADGPLVEVASTVLTAPRAAERAVALTAALGLTPVRCRDRAGFIVDALRFPYLNDAVRMLEAGYADADSIDAAMRLGCGYPTGPIADLDRLGLDRAVAVLRALYAERRENAFAPAPLLEEYLTAGRSFRQ